MIPESEEQVIRLTKPVSALVGWCNAFIALNLFCAYGVVAPVSEIWAREDSPDSGRVSQILSIDWKKGPDLPQGFQDSGGGIVEDTLVTACGFCQGVASWKNRELLDTVKPGRYPRGFLDKTWGLNLEHANDGWKRLPDFPGSARQMLMATVTGGQLYTWGGFSYSEPHCYKDGYSLSFRKGKWSWKQLPDLPWPVYGGGICTQGSKIYLVGGADFDNVASYTESDRSDKVKRIGARLLVIDVDNLDRGWSELAPCPGAPRCAPATAVVNGRLLVIGGGTGMDNHAKEYRSVVDNWCYDTSTHIWNRLSDLPVSSACFPSGSIVAFDRYLLLVGGYQYSNVLCADGSIRPAYGKATKKYPHDYFSDIYVYDAKLNVFGTATPMPLNSFMPMTVVAENRIHLLGGETGGATIDGELFGHHPDLYLVGTIQELDK